MIMGNYVYVLPEHPMKKNVMDFQYLSVKKINKIFHFQVGEKIFLSYRKSKKNGPGIIGFCYVAGQPIRVRDIPKEKRHFCFNRCYWQLPVKDIQCGIRNIIDENVLYALPVINPYGKERVFSECSMIEQFLLGKSINKHSKYWYIWRARRSKKEVEEYNQLFVHELREEYSIDHKTYCKLSKGVSKCSHCGIFHDEYQPYTPPFFEFHENNIPSITEKYNKIDFNNFIALCPNCHKKAHEQMVQQSFIDKEYNYQGFDIEGLAGGWNVDIYAELVE